MNEKILAEKKMSLRKELSHIRFSMSSFRREEAAFSLLDTFSETFAPFTSVLSFMSLPDEINTHLLNRYLARTERLVLPKVTKKELRLYQVHDLENQVARGPFGILEPLPEKCVSISPFKIQVALVPGLGFDAHNHRIGYGKGYYDRLLFSLTRSLTYGIGFKEQFCKCLPVGKNDIPLSEVCLF